MSKLNGFKSQKEANTALVGKQLKVIGNTAGHNVSMGTIITVLRVNYPTTPNPVYIANVNGGNRSFYIEDVELCPLTIEQISDAIKALDTEIEANKKEQEVLRSKIKFMQENKLDVYDEDTFKVYHTLKLLDNDKLSKIEKSNLISQLIKQ